MQLHMFTLLLLLVQNKIHSEPIETQLKVKSPPF